MKAILRPRRFRRRNRRLKTAFVAAVLVTLAAAGIVAGKSSEARAATWPHQSDIVLLIHGIRGGLTVGSQDGTGFDCRDYWAKVPGYLQSSHVVNGQQFTGWGAPIKTIGFYRGDRNCDAYINPSKAGLYSSHCTHASPPSAADAETNSESLYHLSCELAWYIWLSYSQFGQNVQVVAHSMGGLIIRYAIYQAGRHHNQDYQMGNLLVHDVVTFDTPHGGARAAPFDCSFCTEGNEMFPTSSFETELHNGTVVNGVFHPGQSPQGGQGTDWTYIGQGCYQDPVDFHTAIAPSGGHKSYFVGSNCFDHGGFMTDDSDSNNAAIWWCDGCGEVSIDNLNNPPDSSYRQWTSADHSLNHMLHALLLPNW